MRQVSIATSGWLAGVKNTQQGGHALAEWYAMASNANPLAYNPCEDGDPVVVKSRQNLDAIASSPTERDMESLKPRTSTGTPQRTVSHLSVNSPKRNYAILSKMWGVLGSRGT